MRPSARADADAQALTAFLTVLDSCAFTITGSRLARESAGGDPTAIRIEVMQRGPGQIADARRKLAEAVGQVDGAWKRRTSGSDLASKLDPLLADDSTYDAKDVFRSVDHELRVAIGRAKQAATEARERESNRFVRALAWYVRLPDEVAEAAGVEHDRGGRAVGRLVQFALPALPVLAGAALRWLT